MIALAVALVFAQEPYQPDVEDSSDEGAQAMAAFELEEGWSASLWASEPLLANPVVFHVDTVGDVYVCETFRLHAGVTDIRSHMDWLDDDLAAKTVADRLAYFEKHEGEDYADYDDHHERIRLVRDTDGDGAADTAIVFADGFNDPAAGIGAGVLKHGDDVYYTCIPDLWVLRDVDGDGVADRRHSLSNGYGVNVALLGHDLHGLALGPDGRLYFSCGDRGFHLETPEGTIAHPHAGAVLRCELDGSKLEVFHTGLRNPQELVFDPHGNLFTGDNNSDGGDRARWVHVVPGGESGWRYSYQWLEAPYVRGPWNDEKLWHPRHEGQAAYLVPPIANFAHGPSGIARDTGTLPPTLRDHFLLCDFRGDAQHSGVHAFTIEPDGASFAMGPDRRLVWKCLPTDVQVGPDGALWISDWVHGWGMTGKGRIFRLEYEGEHDRELVASTGELLASGFEERDVAELEALLGHVDQRVRLGAQLELVTRFDDGRAALERAATGASDRLARLHGIWGLGILARYGASGVDALALLAEDDVPEVRAQALRTIADARWPGGANVAVGRLADVEPRVRFYAAIAAGALDAPGRLPGLVALLRTAGADDPYQRHAAVMGLEHVDEAELLQLALDDSVHVRMGVLLALRRRESAALAQFLASDEPLLVVEAATAIHDLRIDGAFDALAGACEDGRLRWPAGSDAPNAFVRRVLNANFRLGREEHAVELAAYAAREENPARHRVEALELLADWAEPSSRDRVVGDWLPLEAREASEVAELAALLALELHGVDESGASGDGFATGGPMGRAPREVQLAWLGLVDATKPASMALVLVAWIGDAERDPSVRVRAFEVYEHLGDEGFEATLDLALSDPDGELRAAALAALGRLDVERALPRLPGILARGEIAERRAAYEILGRSGEAAFEHLAREEAKRQAGHLSPELLLDLELAIEASGLIVGRDVTQRIGYGDTLVDPYLPALFGGDAAEGRRIFERVDLSCQRCHTTDGSAGITVGPDLQRVGERLTRLQLLASIVDPNRRTALGYEGTVVELFDGSIVAGRVVGEDDASVRIIDSNATVHEVATADVADRRADLSAMPNGLAAQISRTEMRDLLEFLATLGR